MSRKYTEAKRLANERYEQSKLDHVHLRLPKGKRAEIVKHIETTADASLNAFICRAIDQTIERDAETISNDPGAS